MAPGGQAAQGLALHGLNHDEGRDEVLRRVGERGSRLERADSRYLEDPDVVLAAVASFPAAVEAASPDLRKDFGFAFEAVRRNGLALQHLPTLLRADRTIVAAAAQQNKGALQLAPKELQKDQELASEIRRVGTPADLPVYEGECLRLVGHCNDWRTTDRELRFTCVPPCNAGLAVTRGTGVVSGDSKSVPTRAPAKKARGVSRHRLTVNLRTGCLSFQVVSCARGYAYRVYPAKPSRPGSYTLVAGDPSKVCAAVGGEQDGHHQNFYIDESPTSVVTIFVELLHGFGLSWGPPDAHGAHCRRNTAAVWYVVEAKDFLPSTSILSLREKNNITCDWVDVKISAGGREPSEVRLLADIDIRHEDFQDLVWDALTMTERTFDINQATMCEMFGDDTHLTLLVNHCGSDTLGYCHYFFYSFLSSWYMWIEFLAVAEDLRRKGFGRLLVRWALAQAEDAGCRAIRLNSRGNAVHFYRTLGFEENGRLTKNGLQPMELVLPQRRWTRSEPERPA